MTDTKKDLLLIVQTITNLHFCLSTPDQVDEDEDTGNTSYQRCELTITDDEGNEYTTKNPLVIAATVEFMSNRFMERLADF